MGGRGRRTGIILILVIIIVLGVGVAGVLYLRTLTATPPPDNGGGEGAVPTSTPAPTPPPTRPIIIAADDIRRGQQLTVQDVTIMRWPILQDAPVPTNAMVVDEDPEDPSVLNTNMARMVEGRIARVDILSGQPILDHMLTPDDTPTSLGDSGSDAALLIPSNSVAMAIPITRLSTVGYALRQGDHIDILMSFRFVDVDEEFQTILPNDVTNTLLPADIEGDPIAIAGREEDGPFGTTLVLVPSSLDGGAQRPRQTTQLVIDNAVVLRLGTWPLNDLDRPIVITQAAPAPPPEEGEEGAPAESGGEVPPTPTVTPVPAVAVPDIITLVLSRQDALVLKYALEVGADIDMVLRSAQDDNIDGIVTDSVTLQYIIDFYNVAEPPRLGIAHEPRIDLLDFGGFTGIIANEAPGEGGPENETP